MIISDKVSWLLCLMDHIASSVSMVFNLNVPGVEGYRW